MRTWRDMRPGFYRYRYADANSWPAALAFGYRVDEVHGHFDGFPVVSGARFDPSPMGVAVVEVFSHRIVPTLLDCEPMDPPR